MFSCCLPHLRFRLKDPQIVITRDRKAQITHGRNKRAKYIITASFELSKVFFPVIFIKEISNFGPVSENLLSFRYLTQNVTELSLKEKKFAHKIVPRKKTPPKRQVKYFVFWLNNAAKHILMLFERIICFKPIKIDKLICLCRYATGIPFGTQILVFFD